jgi:hypothetical protein
MLSKERKGEIALLLLAAHFEARGIQLKPDSIRGDLEDVSKKIGIPLAEVNELMEEIVTDLVAKTFKK